MSPSVPGTLPAGYAIESLTFDSIDLLREPMRFLSEVPPAIQVTIRRDPDPVAEEFGISGRVSEWPAGSTGRVRLSFPDSGAVIDTFLSDDGSFAFDRLPRGTYQLRVVDRNSTTRVVVSDGDVRGVVLRPQP